LSYSVLDDDDDDIGNDRYCHYFHYFVVTVRLDSAGESTGRRYRGVTSWETTKVLGLRNWV